MCDREESEQSSCDQPNTFRLIEKMTNQTIENGSTAKDETRRGEYLSNNESAVNDNQPNDGKADKVDSRNKASDSNGESQNKRPRTICYDFKKGLCRRRFCRVSGIKSNFKMGTTKITSKLYFLLTVSACDEYRSGDILS